VREGNASLRYVQCLNYNYAACSPKDTARAHLQAVSVDAAPIALFAEEASLAKLLGLGRAIAAAAAASAAHTEYGGGGGGVRFAPARSPAHASRALPCARRAAATARASASPDTSLLDELPQLQSSGGRSHPGQPHAAHVTTKIYIERLSVSPLKLSLSFRPAGPHAGALAASPAGLSSAGSRWLRLLLSLAQIEGAWVRLKPLELRHPLLRGSDLGQLLSRHYADAAMGELVGLLGSLDVFGDARRLVQVGVAVCGECSSGPIRTIEGPQEKMASGSR
jgi:hypothetical protein